MSFLLPVNGRHLCSTTHPTTDGIPTCLSVLPDPENMDVAVGISLLYSVHAEIYDIAYVHPVNGGSV